MKDTLLRLVRNLKIELFATSLYIAFYVFKDFIFKKFPIKLNINLATYLAQDRLNGIAAFFAITIGVYITVITVLATSEIGITKEMLKRKLDKPLIDVIMAGIIENFISVGFSIFIPLNKITRRILIIFLTISIISFVKFIILLTIIFKINIEQTAKIIDDEEKYNNTMLAYVESIYKYHQKHDD